MTTVDQYVVMLCGKFLWNVCIEVKTIICVERERERERERGEKEGGRRREREEGGGNEN